MLKIKHYSKFRSTLLSAKDKYIVYRQYNFSSEDLLPWSATDTKALIPVVDIESFKGSNVIGEILVEYV